MQQATEKNEAATQAAAAKKAAAAAAKKAAAAAAKKAAAEAKKAAATAEIPTLNLKLNTRTIPLALKDIQKQCNDYLSERTEWNAVCSKHSENSKLNSNLDEVDMSTINKQASIMRKHSQWKSERITKHVTRFALIDSLRKLSTM
jgi:membrane protein involved in colicin uptake